MEDSKENPCIEVWPEDIGTKPWFQRYVSSIYEYATRPGQMSPEQANVIHKSLAKFDPKFAELCKKAHDSAIEFMNYAKERSENK